MTTPTLAELKASVLEDKIIDEEEVKQIREAVYADGVIDREEADFLFELNDATSGKNHASWTPFFVEAIGDHVLKDEKSPGEIDSDEAVYLKGKIHGDGKVDATEKALLVRIKAEAKGTIPTDLNFMFELYLD